jgi:hypothetical protein
MKKYILLLFVFCFTQLKSQQFFNSGVHYLTIGEGYDGSSWWYWHDYYHMVLDSVSNDTQYYTKWNTNRPNTDTGQANIRAEEKFKVIYKRVFISRDESEKGDFLLYDFNLEEGDSARVNGFGASMIHKNALLIVDSIRNIQLGPFTYKAQYVKVNERPFTFVENIGSLENGVLFFSHYEFESGNEMINLCRSDTLLFWKEHFLVKSGGNTCSPVFYRSDINNPAISSQAFAFPNPSNGVVQIHTGDLTENLALEIYGMNGQLIMAVKVADQEFMDLRALPAGLYYVRLLSPDGDRQQVLSID